MGENDVTERVELDEGALLKAVRALATGQPGEARQVVVSELVDALLAERSFPSPAEAWRVKVALQRRIAELAQSMPGLTYVEGDA